MGDIGVHLASLMLGDERTARHAAGALAGNGIWGEVVTLAGLWRVVPALRRQVTALQIQLGDAATQRLRQASRAAAVQSTALAHRGTEILERFAAAAIPALAFKGLGAIATLYDGRPSDRMLGDIDLLIEERHSADAGRILEGLGFKPVIREVDALVDYLDRRPLEGAGSGNHFGVFIDADHLEVDLHWRIGSRSSAVLDAAPLLRRAEMATLYGRTIRVAAPSDAIILTVHHAVRSHLMPASTVKDLIDLKHWLRMQPARWRVDDVIEQTRAAQLAAPLLGLWQVLAGFDPVGPAVAAVAQVARALSAPERRDADRLCDLFHLQLRYGNVNTDLLQLLSFDAMRRFLTRRLRHAAVTKRMDRRIEQALDLPPPMRPAGRLAALVRDISRLTPRRLVAYRALLRAHAMRGVPHA